MVKSNPKLLIGLITVVIAVIALLYSWRIDKKVQTIIFIQREIWSKDQFEEGKHDSLVNISKELLSETYEPVKLNYNNLRDIANGPLENRYHELRRKQSIAKWSAVVLIVLISIVQTIRSVKRKS
jgi:hypothetical protein